MRRFYVGLLVLVAVVAAFFYFFTVTLQGQVRDVIERLPQAIDSLGERFDISNPVERRGRTIFAGAAGDGRR